MRDRQTIDHSDLRRWVNSGEIKGAGYKQAVDFFRDRDVWGKWALGALLALGAGHVLAGVIFFFAFNWYELSAASKFLIVQGGIVLSVLVWLALRLDRGPAPIFGIAATVLIGVLLAVFGQVYQTPAAFYTPFILWAVLSFPFALASRSVAHWAVWLVIAVFAASTYFGEGVAKTYGPDVARGWFLWLGALLLGISALYHNLSRKRFVWARTSWFRLSILVAAYLILFSLFTEGFWDSNSHLVWIVALLLTGGALAVIYRFWPTLPALSLTTFTLSAMISQFGFRVILEVFDSFSGDSFFGVLLLCFAWAFGLTLCLAKAFRHFQTKFGDGSTKLETENEALTETPKQLSDLADALSLPQDTLAKALDTQGEDSAPWYVEALLGIAGMFTAVFAMGLLASFVALFLSGQASSVYAGFGFVVWITALFIRRGAASRFMQYFCNMFILGGGALAVGAMADVVDFEVSFVFFGLAITLVTLFLVKDRIIEFIMALGVFGLVSYSLYEFSVPRPYIWACILFTSLAVIGLSWPIRNRLYAAAGTAFLLVVPIASATYEKSATLAGLGLTSSWPEIVTGLAVTVIAVLFLNQLKGRTETFQPPLPVFIPLLLAIAIMPLGGAAALLVIFVGYIFGSRSLTLIGVLMQIGFLIWLYYDLQISLFHKSILLVVSGLIFIAIWWFLRKIGESVNV